MNNGASNQQFLNTVDVKTRDTILNNVAKHYGVSAADALDEVTDADAENLLDYVTGPERAATSVLMQKHGFR